MLSASVGTGAQPAIHTGFLNGAQEAAKALANQLQLRKPDCPLWLTGHSMAGAYALCAGLLMQANPDDCSLLQSGMLLLLPDQNLL